MMNKNIQTTGKNKMILITGDGLFASFFKSAMEYTPYDHSVASSIDEAFERHAPATANLIYMDIDANGADPVGALKKLSAACSAPIYVITPFDRAAMDRLSGAVRDGVHFELMNKSLRMDYLIMITTTILDGIKRR